MRMLLKAQLDVDKSNQALSEGRLQEALRSVLNDLKPEAAYFAPLDGKRTALIVFDMDDPSDLPRISEPFFQTASAAVEVMPVMNADDLLAGLQKVGR
jgi:hypothetical protein